MYLQQTLREFVWVFRLEIVENLLGGVGLDIRLRGLGRSNHELRRRSSGDFGVKTKASPFPLVPPSRDTARATFEELLSVPTSARTRSGDSGGHSASPRRKKGSGLWPGPRLWSR